MPSITVEENGRPEVITDITPCLTERADIGDRLERVYATFDEQRVEALAPQEALIIELVNRYNELSHWIALFETEEQRIANIQAGWALLQEIRAARA